VQVRNEIRQGGITYAIPPGWTKQLTASCGPQPNHTVAGPFTATPMRLCPFEPDAQPRTTVRIDPIWTEDGSTGWTGKPADWHDQVAYLDTTTGQGRTTVTLSLPLLNARVMATSPDPQTARALLERITPHPTPGLLPVPPDAFSIGIVRTNAVRPQSPPVVVTDRADVAKLLDDLRRSGKAGADTCLPAWTRTPTVITINRINGPSTSYLTSLDGCPILTAGTGAAASASPALTADIDRYVPANLNVPPDPSITVPVCTSGQLIGTYGGHVSPMTEEHSLIVNLRNSGSKCQVFGYPFVNAFGPTGPIGGAMQNGGGYVLETPSVVVLGPGESAHFVVAAASASLTCQVESVIRVQITVRGNQAPVTVTMPDGGSLGLQLCPGDSGAHIGPLVAGAMQGL
jgi:hypothetical protein